MCPMTECVPVSPTSNKPFCLILRKEPVDLKRQIVLLGKSLTISRQCDWVAEECMEIKCSSTHFLGMDVLTWKRIKCACTCLVLFCINHLRSPCNFFLYITQKIDVGTWRPAGTFIWTSHALAQWSKMNQSLLPWAQRKMISRTALQT